eukprot:5812388-Amphidinium_carterae.1
MMMETRLHQLLFHLVSCRFHILFADFPDRHEEWRARNQMPITEPRQFLDDSLGTTFVQISVATVTYATLTMSRRLMRILRLEWSVLFAGETRSSKRIAAGVAGLLERVFNAA